MSILKINIVFLNFAAFSVALMKGRCLLNE